MSTTKTLINLGTYQTIACADDAYKLAANKHFGEFAYHNSRRLA